MIKGESITLIEETQTGVDPFGAPIFSEAEVIVDDVIIGQPDTNDAVAELNLTGKRIAFVLGIPKGDNHIWKDKKIIIRGELFRSFGFPLTQTAENVPGKWNTQVKVERYE